MLASRAEWQAGFQYGPQLLSTFQTLLAPAESGQGGLAGSCPVSTVQGWGWL